MLFIYTKNIYIDTVPKEDKITKTKKAKSFDKIYNTHQYQIFCQLMIKEDDQWYMTGIYCKTHVITDV